jgi:type VI secretion system protein ImpK
VKLLAYTVELREWREETPPSFNDVQSDVETMLAEAEQLRRQGGFKTTDYEMAKFAVCAFVDETIMLSNWEERMTWLPLQRRVFNTTSAGEEFFNILDELPITSNEIREVFAVCLSLGFTGRYFAERDKQILDGVKAVTLTTVLPEEEESWENDLLPEAYPDGHGAVRNLLWGRLNRWTILLMVLPPALFITLFVFYRFLLGRVIFDFFSSAS